MLRIDLLKLILIILKSGESCSKEIGFEPDFTSVQDAQDYFYVFNKEAKKWKQI